MSARDYRQLFAAIDAESWTLVEACLPRAPTGYWLNWPGRVLNTHANSPKVSAEQIAAWFNAGVDLPQAEQLARMGPERGVEISAPPSVRAGFARQHPRPQRILPRTVNDGTMPAATAQRDSRKRSRATNHGRKPSACWRRPTGSFPAMPGPNGASAWRGAHYIENNDTAALELARTGRRRAPANGSPKAHGRRAGRVSGWGIVRSRSDAFAAPPPRASKCRTGLPPGILLGASFAGALREPGQAQQHLRAAALMAETLYGMLAADQLGIELPGPGAPPRPSETGTGNSSHAAPNPRRQSRCRDRPSRSRRRGCCATRRGSPGKPV